MKEEQFGEVEFKLIDKEEELENKNKLLKNNTSNDKKEKGIFLSPDLVSSLKTRISRAKKILLISHISPDGDTLGSSLGLFHALRKIGKHVECACVDEAASCLNFLPGIESFQRDFSPLDYDLIFTLDCGASYMTGFSEKYPDVFKNDPRVINIDHHQSNDNFGDINIVFSESCCTTLIVTEILKSLDIDFDMKIATCLLTGLYTDTGSFMHSNANPLAFRMAAFLMKKGGDYRVIVKNIFRTIPVGRLKLWGEVLKNIKISRSGFAISGVSKRDFKKTKTSPDDLSGVVDFVNSVEGANFSMLLTEREDKVKGSFRTLRDDIDLSRLAKMFGGGGHRKAAGFSVEGRLRREVRFRLDTTN